MNKPIYLHFMDRELRETVSGKLTDESALNLVCMGLFMSIAPMYVPFATVFESINDFPQTVRFLVELEKYNRIMMVTQARDLEEFIKQRHILYDYDKKRYEMYFGGKETLWPNAPTIIAGRTTDFLRKKFFLSLYDIISLNSKLKGDIYTKLSSNRTDALTYSFFKSLVTKGTVEGLEHITVEHDLRYMVSKDYTVRYLEAMDGTIITSIPCFGQYDSLATSRYNTNFMLFFELLGMTYLKNHIQAHGVLEGIVANESTRVNFCRVLNEICTLLSRHPNSEWATIDSQTILKNFHLDKRATSLTDMLGEYHLLLERLKKHYHDTVVEGDSMQVLLIVATDIELDVTIDICKKNNAILIPFISTEFSYFIAKFDTKCVYIVKSQMGSGGPGGSTLTTADAIMKLSPRIVVMGGIAFGANNDKQKIGDVLLSERIWAYDAEKLTEDTGYPRGAITPVNPQLFQMLEMTYKSKERSFGIKKGLMASGGKLSDRKAFVDALKNVQPEMIGADMESTGTMDTCLRMNKQCVFVKGICDWGYDKNAESIDKAHDQTVAATNSIQLIVEAVMQMI